MVDLARARFTVDVQKRLVDIYADAARKFLVFSSLDPNESLVHKEIQLLGTFALHCLYTDQITSRLLTDDTGYYLSQGSNLRIPLFRQVAVPIEPWSADDDDEIGRTAKFVIERRPFEQVGALFHSVQTFLGYFVEADANPESIIGRCRLLNKHLARYTVEEYVQCISQGCWSQFNDRNEDVHILEVRYKIPENEIQTWHGEKVFSPLLVLNRKAIMEGQEYELSTVWRILCSVLITAIQFQPGQEEHYGLRIPLGATSFVLELSRFVDPPNLPEVLGFFCRVPYIELLCLEAVRFSRKAALEQANNGGPPQAFPNMDIAPLITHADLKKKCGAIRKLYCRTIPKSRLFDPNATFSLKRIDQVKESTKYETILPVIEAGLLVAHKIQKGFSLRPDSTNGTQDDYYTALVKKSLLPIHLSDAAAIPLTYLALDDIEIPPLFLRNSQRQRWPVEQRSKMLEEAHGILGRRWKYITSGESPDDCVGRRERFVDVMPGVHEFA